MLPIRTSVEQGATPESLGPESQQAVVNALNCVSTQLGNRLSALAHSQSTPDIYEALTAVVHLMSSAASLPYVSKESRRQSFERGAWNRLGRTQAVEDMVESGFFYLQEDDHVKCFFCDLGLKDWEAGDSPELEHARFSPFCFFLKSSRGLDWLRRSAARQDGYPSSYTRQDHNQLLKILSIELQGKSESLCKIVFNPTKVLLCVARKFIRFRQRFTDAQLLQEMLDEWHREMSGQPELYIGRFDLASALKAFRSRMELHERELNLQQPT